MGIEDIYRCSRSAPTCSRLELLDLRGRSHLKFLCMATVAAIMALPGVTQPMVRCSTREFV
jgi:hypothetical protein